MRGRRRSCARRCDLQTCTGVAGGTTLRPLIHSSAPASGDEVAAHYDDLDFFYRDVWGEHVHHGLWRSGKETREEAVRQLAELVAAEAQGAPGQSVCDIGCGYGATARLLAA